MAKKVEQKVEVVEAVETVESTETTEVDNIEETSDVNETVETVEVADNKGKNFAAAEKRAGMYGVTTVWCTADGVYWATTEEKRRILPANRGGIEEYSFFQVEN